MSMPFTLLYRRVEIQGLMPERALLKLRRAGVEVFSLTKPEKNRVVFSVKKKDIEKFFAIYTKVCYNRNGNSPYSVRDVGGIGVEKHLDFLKKRVGLLLGGLLFSPDAVGFHPARISFPSLPPRGRWHERSE